MTGTIQDRLRAGEWVAVGDKIYALCRDCGKIVQVNKRFFGSHHICAYPKEAR